jgi:hypothetical protein
MPKEGPKVEITGYYSYFCFNPENSGTLNSHSLNGGGADIGYSFSKMLGIKAEFAGYQSLTTAFTNNISSGRVSANLFTYNAGLVVKFRSDRLEPFAEALFGGAHSSFCGNLCKQLATCISQNPINNASDFVLGGGLDIPLSHAVSVRLVQADYADLLRQWLH